MAFQRSTKKDSHDTSYDNAELGEGQIELSHVAGNVYDCLEARDRDSHINNEADKAVAMTNSDKSNVNNKGHCIDRANAVATSSLKVELTCWAICLAAIGMLLFCTLICVISGVIVYHVTSTKTTDSGRETSQVLDITSRTNTSEALVIELKSLNAEFIRFNDARTVQMNSLSDNLTGIIRRLDTLDTAVQDVPAVQEAVQSIQEKQNASDSTSHHGSTYVRWGRTSCGGGNGTQLIYKGYMAGSHYTHSGDGANQLCLPEDPTWGKYNDAPDSIRGYIYGTEYEEFSGFFGKNVGDQDAPCAVCLTAGITVMIPARTACYPGWTVEYSGYLMSNLYTYKKNNYICVDGDPEFIANGTTNVNGHVIYLVEGRCGALVCPPYVEYRELACSVCSKIQ